MKKLVAIFLLIFVFIGCGKEEKTYQVLTYEQKQIIIEKYDRLPYTNLKAKIEYHKKYIHPNLKGAFLAKIKGDSVAEAEFFRMV